MKDTENRISKKKSNNGAGSFSFLLQHNPKYCVGKFANVVPFILYDEVGSKYRYIVRCRPLYLESKDSCSVDDIIAEYDSIESLVNDGWRMD